MTGRKKIAKLIRYRTRPEIGGETLHFRIEGTSRPEFLPVSAVPEFEGDQAWFELERVRGRPWLTWKVLRRVDEPEHSAATRQAAPSGGPMGDGAPPANSPFRTFNDWQEDPWAKREDVERRRRERHKRWIASITARDWERLDQIANQICNMRPVAGLDDLDAPIRIGLIAPDHPLGTGQRFGTFRGFIMVAYQKDSRR